MKKIKRSVLLSTVLLSMFVIFSMGCIENANKIQTLSNEGDDNSWCSSDNLINSPNSSDAGYIIKGITNYNGSEVCEAEWKYDGGSVTEYFTIDGNSTMVYKDINGSITNENFVTIEDGSNNESVTVDDYAIADNETIADN